MFEGFLVLSGAVFVWLLVVLLVLEGTIYMSLLIIIPNNTFSDSPLLFLHIHTILLIQSPDMEIWTKVANPLPHFVHMGASALNFVVSVMYGKKTHEN